MKRTIKRIMGALVSLCMVMTCLPAAALGNTMDPLVSKTHDFDNTGASKVRVLSMEAFHVEALTKDGLKFLNVQDALDRLAEEVPEDLSDQTGVPRIYAQVFGGAPVVEWKWTRTVDGHAISNERQPYVDHEGDIYWVNIEERDLAENTFYSYTFWAKDANGYEDSCTITFMVLDGKADSLDDYIERTIFKDGTSIDGTDENNQAKENPLGDRELPAVHGQLVHKNAELTVTDAEQATRTQMEELVAGANDSGGGPWQMGPDAWNMGMNVSAGDPTFGPSAGPLDVILPVDESLLPEGADTVLVVGVRADGSTFTQEAKVQTDADGNKYVVIEGENSSLGAYSIAYPIPSEQQIRITAMCTGGGHTNYDGTHIWAVDDKPTYVLTPDPFWKIESIAIGVDGVPVSLETLQEQGVELGYDLINMDVTAILTAAGIPEDQWGDQEITLDVVFTQNLPDREAYKLNVYKAEGGHVEVLINGEIWRPTAAGTYDWASVPSDAVIQFTFVADDGWEFDSANIEEAGRGGAAMVFSTVKTIFGLKGDMDVWPTFRYTGGPTTPPAVAYTVTTRIAQESLGHGTVDQKDESSVRTYAGDTASFTIAASAGYGIASVVDDRGNNLIDLVSYPDGAPSPALLTVSNVTSNMVITVTLRTLPEFIDVNVSVKVNLMTFANGIGAYVVPENIRVPYGSSYTFYVVPESEEYVLENAWYTTKSSARYTNVTAQMEWVPDADQSPQVSQEEPVGQQNREIPIDGDAQVTDSVSYGYYKITLTNLTEDAELLIYFRDWIEPDDTNAGTPKRSGTREWRNVTIQSNVTDESGVLSPENQTVRLPVTADLHITVKARTENGWDLESVYLEELERTATPELVTYANDVEADDADADTDAGENGSVTPLQNLKDQVSANRFTVLAPESKNDQRVTFTFVRTGASTPEPVPPVGVTFTITPIVEGKGGQISPSEPVTVPKGGSYSFSFSREMGYRVASVTVDGVAIEYTQKGCTVTNVQKDETLVVRMGVATTGQYATPIERAVKTLTALAKTGDLNIILVLFFATLACGAAGILLLLAGRRRKQTAEGDAAGAADMSQAGYTLVLPAERSDVDEADSGDTDDVDAGRTTE